MSFNVPKKLAGRNNWGQLGQGDYLDRGDAAGLMGNNLTDIDLGTSPTANGTAVVAVAVTTGHEFTCVLVDGGGVKVSYRGGGAGQNVTVRV